MNTDKDELSDLWIIPLLKQGLIPTCEANFWSRLGYNVYNAYCPTFVMRTTPLSQINLD